MKLLLTVFTLCLGALAHGAEPTVEGCGFVIVSKPTLFQKSYLRKGVQIADPGTMLNPHPTKKVIVITREIFNELPVGTTLVTVPSGRDAVVFMGANGVKSVRTLYGQGDHWRGLEEMSFDKTILNVGIREPEYDDDVAYRQIDARDLLAIISGTVVNWDTGITGTIGVTELFGVPLPYFHRNTTAIQHKIAAYLIEKIPALGQFRIPRNSRNEDDFKKQFYAELVRLHLSVYIWVPATRLEWSFYSPGENKTYRESSKTQSGRDVWAVLGLATGASLAEIKSAYRKKVKEINMDSPDAKGDENEFKVVNEAYAILTGKGESGHVVP